MTQKIVPINRGDVPKVITVTVWGGTLRVWVLISHDLPHMGYVLQGKPFVRFEERGRLLEEIKDFYQKPVFCKDTGKTL